MLTRMTYWTSGFTQSELDQAQERYDIRFPPDLAAFLLDRRPADGGYDWSTDDHRIDKMLAWPTELLLFDVENGLWWPGWGERPAEKDARAEVVRDAIRRVPKLIPIFNHRFIPQTPDIAGNPVFSMHGFDTIYYGANLNEYFENEFGGARNELGKVHNIGPTRYISFWSDIVDW
jgi:hypothetical protein